MSKKRKIEAWELETGILVLAGDRWRLVAGVFRAGNKIMVEYEDELNTFNFYSPSTKFVTMKAGKE